MVDQNVQQVPEEPLDPEDFFSDSLQILYNYQRITLTTAGEFLEYKSHLNCTHHEPGQPSHCEKALVISLRTPDTASANWALQASSIWASSIYMADHLSELHLNDHIRAASASGRPCRILELGASAGLPSILVAKLYSTGVAITATDYPDEILMQTLLENVQQNGVGDICRVLPFAWGTVPRWVPQDSSEKFDVVIAADTLWNPDLHGIFIHTLKLTMKKSAESRIHLVVGLHTGRYTIGSFLRQVLASGFDLECITERELKGSGFQRNWYMSREGEDDQERRRWIIWIQLKWTTTQVEL